jgi:hypothetical protein
MSAVELALIAAALAIGLTGAWSPCGFSMVETIGLRGDDGRRATTLAACATFAPGAALGGALTFGSLAALGEVAHGAGGRVAYFAAAGIALAAAALEARGARIAPQIRRQLPERWRWVLPMPLAALLYGVLLGLGFTTFVLSFGVWALAGISFALGAPGTGLAIGIAFGVGRALPVAVLAPIADRPLGVRCTALMAERPALYRGFRLGDAVALALAAVALGAGSSASAANTVVTMAADPSAAGRTLVYQRADQSGALRSHGQTIDLPGTDPAIGGPYIAVIAGGDQIRILDRASRAQLGTVGAPGVDAVAISERWLAYRIREGGRDSLKARRIRDPAQPGHQRSVDATGERSQISQPDLDGNLLVYAISKPAASRILRERLGSNKRDVILGSRRAQLTNPSVLGHRVLYVRVSRERQGPQQVDAPPLHQRLMLKPLGAGGEGRRLYRRGRGGVLWSTALARRAYATLLHGGDSRILSVGH